MDLNDNRLAAIARGDEPTIPTEVEDMAAELLRLRRHARTDSRRSVQIRRLRWAVENLIVKTERLMDKTAPPHDAVVDKMVAAAGELHREVRALPLELEEVSVATIVAKWLRSDALLNALEAREWSDIPDELATRIDRSEWKEALHG